MRILLVNISGIIGGERSNLQEADVFQDYEAIVIDPESFYDLYGIRDTVISTEVGMGITSINFDRCKQVSALLQRGGVVVCLMQPEVRGGFSLRYDGEDHWLTITNYDWLLNLKDREDDLGKIISATGKTIDFIDVNNPFFPYLNTKPRWIVYVDKEKCKNWKIIASAYGTHAISLTKRIGLGHIILLPSYYNYHNGELLKQCIIKLLGDKETTPRPEWVKTISLPGQEELIVNISKINEQVNVLEKQRDAFIVSNNHLERWKYLLFEKGKQRLEPIVHEALNLIGCKVEPQPDKDSDGIVICDYGSALLEIVGSKETIKIEKLGELIKNIGNYISEKGGSSKGILIGNPFCEEPLENRPPKGSQKNLFAIELIESANKQDISILLTTDLFEIVCQILDKKTNTEKLKAIQEKIFKGQGLVRLV